MEEKREDPRLETPARVLSAVSLALVVLLALALRLIDLDKSFWYDEVAMYRDASVPFLAILRERTYPLCYLIFHALLQIGDGEALLRIPNVVEGVLGVVAIYFVARALKGRVAGLTAALLLAVNPFHLQHSQDARFYALLALTGLIAAWLLHRALARGGVTYWVGFTLSASLGLATHTFFLPFLGAMALGAGAWILLSRQGNDAKARLTRTALLGLCVLLGMAPSLLLWMGQGRVPTRFVAQSEEQAPAAPMPGAPAQQPADRQEKAETPPRVDRGHHILTVDEYLHCFTMFYYRGFGKVACILIVFAVWGGAWLFWRKPPMASIILSCLILVPGVLLFVPVKHFYQARYFIISLPLSILLIATGLQCLYEFTARFLAVFAPVPPGKPRPRWPGVLAFGSVAGVLLILAPWMLTSIRQYQAATPAWDWKGAFKEIAEHAAPTDRVVFVTSDKAPDLITLPCHFYLKRLTSGTSLEAIHPDEVTRAEELSALTRAHPNAGFWLVGGEYPGFIAPTLGGEFEPLLQSLNAGRRPYQHAAMAVIKATKP